MSALDDITEAAAEHGFDVVFEDNDFHYSSYRRGFGQTLHEHLIKVHLIDRDAGSRRNDNSYLGTFTSCHVLFNANGSFHRASRYGATQNPTLTKSELLKKMATDNLRVRAANRAKVDAQIAAHDRERDEKALLELTAQVTKVCMDHDKAASDLFLALESIGVDTTQARLNLLELLRQPNNEISRYLFTYNNEQDLLQKIRNLRAKLA